MDAKEALSTAFNAIDQRGETRDCNEERSMASCVAAFNAMFDKKMSEEQGWWFMVLLKMSRSKGGKRNEDDYVDGAAYCALAGECDD
jgi:hypothetical protein